MTATVCLQLAATAEAQNTEWDKAANEIVRLPPSSFPALPSAIRTQLETQGCTIPQTYGQETPHNVVKGRFAAPSQTDWAVLCSRNGQSGILVFWGGERRCAAFDRQSPDRGWLQGIGEGKIGFSQAIAPIGRAGIMSHYNSYGGPKPPPIDHDGLDHAFSGKASTTFYCYRGKWLTLQGAD